MIYSESRKTAKMKEEERGNGREKRGFRRDMPTASFPREVDDDEEEGQNHREGF